ncbi:hypothetical protein JXQ70_00425 [bacterium]|nr:hypothetical protein [bacterium]
MVRWESYLRIILMILMIAGIISGMADGKVRAEDLDVLTDLQIAESQIYVLLANTDDMDFQEWKQVLREADVFPRHWFPPHAAIVVLPVGQNLSHSRIMSGQAYVQLSPSDYDSLCALSESMKIAVEAFEHLRAFERFDDLETGSPLINDAMEPPDTQQKVSCSAYGLLRSTSDYMLGQITVNAILAESDGSIDTSTENWTGTLETNVTNEIVEGMNDLSNYYDKIAALTPSFTYHFYYGRTNALAQTGYEPINRTKNDESLWVSEIYNNLGYSADSDMHAKGRHFNGDQRAADGTDWAFTIFVANSYADSDGLFNGGGFAWSWLSGPHHILTYDNDGWGISQMNKVARHETGHNFNAWDEYRSSGCECDWYNGYVTYYDENCNHVDGCTTNVPCIMSESAQQYNVCYYTMGTIGWGDLDSDTIPDPVDINPTTTLTAYSPDPTTNTTLNYTGSAAIVTLSNQNQYGYRCDRNILTLAGVQYRADSSPWYNAVPTDGSFNSGSESYYFQVTLSPGTHTIETRAVDELGQYDPSPASDTVTIEGGSNPPGEPTSLNLTYASNQVHFSWNVPTGNCDIDDYGIYTGNLLTLSSGFNADQQLTCSTGAATTWSEFLASLPYSMAYFVVVSLGGSSEGSYGVNSQSTQRSQSTNPCKVTHDTALCP